MDHVAIMNKSWQLIPKILSGEKTIESRWYQTRRAPWGSIAEGDRVFFKNSGERVTARATVRKVMQFEIGNTRDITDIIDRYGKEIRLVNQDPKTWGKLPKYCVLIQLGEPKPVTPFNINKDGFGTGAAWLTIPDINSIRQ